MASELARALLSPRRIALIGASDDASKTAARPLMYLRRAGYSGAVYPVNPKREQVLGERAWRSVADVPERPDHAYILTPTEGVLDSVEQCARAGIPVATILATGFSEAGDEGNARQAKLKQLSDTFGIRIVGPSSLGVVNIREKVLITANAAFAEPDLPAGHVFCATHSGSLIGAFVSRGKAHGIGFAGLVSVGNEVDLGIGDVCAATLDDPNIHGYVLFLESLRKADAIRSFALQAAERGRPVLAYKVGRSAAARELAVTHTGALAGEDDVAGMFLAECGIARVETFDALIEGLPVLMRVPPRRAKTRPPAVGIVTTTGGGAAMVVDQLGLRGISVVEPSAATWERLHAAGVKAEHGRIVDLTMAGTRYDVMKAALDTLLTAPEYDMIVAVVGSSARFRPELAVAPIVDSGGRNAHLAAFLVPEAPDALARLSQAGIPSFRNPEMCADAVAAALSRRVPRMVAHPVKRLPLGAGGTVLDEAEARALLGDLGIPLAPAVVADAKIEKAPDLPFDYPVALKILSPDIAHKTEAGGVALNVADTDALVREVNAMRLRVASAKPGANTDKVLIQPMVSGIGEVLIGYKVDPDVGPMVLLAPGGVLAELAQERSLRLAPIDVETAREMIGELNSLKSLGGFRNRPRGDLEALANALVALSGLAQRPQNVMEAEINPLIVKIEGSGVVAVDALVRLG